MTKGIKFNDCEFSQPYELATWMLILIFTRLFLSSEQLMIHNKYVFDNIKSKNSEENQRFLKEKCFKKLK